MAKGIDAQRLVRHFGGPTALQAELAKRGHTISVKGINMWVTRGAVSSEWLVRLAEIADAEGRQFRLQDFAAGSVDRSFLE